MKAIASTKINNLVTITLYEVTGDLTGCLIGYEIEAVCDLSGQTRTKETRSTLLGGSLCFQEVCNAQMQTFIASYARPERVAV